MIRLTQLILMQRLMWQHVSALLTNHHQAIYKFRPYEYEVLLLISQFIVVM
jgi:hypothetical protein